MGMPTFWIPVCQIDDLTEMLLDLGGTADPEPIPKQPERFDIYCNLPSNKCAGMSVTLNKFSSYSTINVIVANSLLAFEIAFSSWVIAVGGTCNRHMKVNTVLKGESPDVYKFLCRLISSGANDIWAVPLRALYSQKNLGRWLASHIRHGGGPYIIVADMHGIHAGKSFIAFYFPRMWGGLPKQYLVKVRTLIEEAEREGMVCLQEKHPLSGITAHRELTH